MEYCKTNDGERLRTLPKGELNVWLLVFITGLLIGSFINVCVHRLPKDESIVFPSSRCPSCKMKLRSIDLVPVISWLFLKGKCRFCNKSISSRYPLVELLTGFLVTLVYMETGVSMHFIFYSIITFLLIVIVFIDLDHQIIPDGVNLIIALLGTLYSIYIFYETRSPVLLNSLGGILLGGGFFLLIAILSKGGMGGGDIKLMAALGIWFGWQGILMVTFLSFLIGGIYAIGLMLIRNKGRKDMVPFGPFIALAAFLTFLYEPYLLLWYLDRFINI
ncbi:leader peptidase (prepilin peptidase) / N-methyltransferase [Tindallia californiensis]|uniref:Prepilin leader peptidase/N-methyltransferase n=1 Tax=Tindallia californiensis TaxID=159292 RepID=A0A1H3NJF5_9FIRM|nr:leader peptidase (prepilin peptidase) / N-methyltransferase [Tindallia californiensis]